MSSYLIIRDLPKTIVSMDLIYHETDENFIGFNYLTSGIHHFSVKLKSGKITGFWFFVEGGEPLEALLSDESGTVIVKRYDAASDAIVDDTEENVRKYTDLALSDNLDDNLYDSHLTNRIPSWTNLTSYIEDVGSIPPLKPTQDENQSFTTLRNDVYSGDIVPLIAEFQFCFLCMLAGADEGYDQEAMRRWSQMMRFICSATLDEVNNYKQFYIEWVDALIHQLQCLPTTVFQANDDNLLHLVIFRNSATILESIEKIEYSQLVKRGVRLEKYLKQRAAGLE